jgi:outer membrane biosynthesis protein TonB
VDKEVLRVFNSSPKWIPAKYHGSNVEVNIGAIFIVDVNTANKTMVLTKPKPAVMSDAERENAVFTAVETPPTHRGGIKEFNSFLNKNVKYPQNALDQKIDGKVIVSFVIEKDGSLSAFKVLRSPSDDLSNDQ